MARRQVSTWLAEFRQNRPDPAADADAAPVNSAHAGHSLPPRDEPGPDPDDSDSEARAARPGPPGGRADAGTGMGARAPPPSRRRGCLCGRRGPAHPRAAACLGRLRPVPVIRVGEPPPSVLEHRRLRQCLPKRRRRRRRRRRMQWRQSAAEKIVTARAGWQGLCQRCSTLFGPAGAAKPPSDAGTCHLVN